MTALAELTASEKILLAAHELEDKGETPFSAETLVVRSWKKYPNTFGLKGYGDEYPDSNKVLASIMGEKGLARKGWLAKVGAKMYSLTRDGKHAARRLLHPDEPPPVRRPADSVKLTKDNEKLLTTLVTSTALQKYLEGRPSELTFADACRFWGITENLSGDQLESQMENFGAELASLEAVIGASRTVLPGGRSVSGDEVGKLDELNGFLKQRFARHLSLLRNRMERVERN